jgi:hypothetical protein
MDNKTTIKDIVLKTLFIIGVLIIVAILIFGIIKVVPKIFSGATSLFSGISNQFKDEQIKISVDKNEVNSGQNILMNFKYSEDKKGVYALKYECVENVSLRIVTEQGIKNILCDRLFIVGDKEQAEIIPILEKENSFFDLPIEVSFGEPENNQIHAKASIIINIKNSGDINASATNFDIANNQATITTDEPQGTSAPITSPTTNSQPSANAPLADLEISNIVATNNQISFTVSNIGGRMTNQWIFSYLVPNENVQYSPIQRALSPRESIRYTLSFNENLYTGPAIINLNATNTFTESNKNNNVGVFNIVGRDSGSDPVNPSNRPDLEISNLEIGYLSGNRFTANNTIYERDDFAIKFTVRNIGGQSTGSWRFELSDLPISGSRNFISDRQTSLAPNETREIIVGLGYAEIGSYRIRVDLDPNNEVREDNSRNNRSDISIRVR